MKIVLDKNGEFEIVGKAKFEKCTMKTIIKRIVNGGHTNNVIVHSRWSVLYNAYDMVYDTDIRDEHESFVKESNLQCSRLVFAEDTDRLGRLFYVASKLYNIGFEEYIEEYMAIGYIKDCVA